MIELTSEPGGIKTHPFIYMVYYIDRLSYVEPSLHLWDKAYLIMVDNAFDVFLESVYQYSIEYFCINVHEGDCFNLVNLSIGWNLPSSAFCKAGFMDRLGLFMGFQISWTFYVMTFLDLVFSLTDESLSSIAGVFSSCCLALDSSSSFPCPAFRAIAKSWGTFKTGFFCVAPAVLELIPDLYVKSKLASASTLLSAGISDMGYLVTCPFKNGCAQLFDIMTRHCHLQSSCSRTAQWSYRKKLIENPHNVFKWELTDMVVWVTGASSGIGEELAFQLSKLGVSLVLSARRVQELERVKRRCLENSNLKEKDILVLPLDLTNTISHESATKAVLREFGKIDILVNNSGRSQRSLVLETNLDVFKELINLNYLGTVSLTKCVLPHMVERKQGKIVTVNSIAGIASVPLSSGYCASKHALRGFFSALQCELIKYPGITFCNVYPGPVQSDIVKNALTEEVTK
ncbi:hypothetical protein STEG23_027074, partial [Scotinomys teguina]